MMLDEDVLLSIARQAGDAIMEIYAGDFDVYEKQDDSPLTQADLAAHNIIIEELKKHSSLPILSEENADISWEERQKWQRYWLVDPLDGTKEFIKKNGEFTVNIALIDNGIPVQGVVHAPALNVSYYGASQQGAWKYDQQGKHAIKVRSHKEGEIWQVVGSRSHQSPAIQAWLEALPGDTDLVAMGSSLKLCLVAEGVAHVYPRLGPTSEWDTGAAHAIVLAAGGSVVEHETDQPLKYNQQASVLNPYFIVRA